MRAIETQTHTLLFYKHIKHAQNAKQDSEMQDGNCRGNCDVETRRTAKLQQTFLTPVCVNMK